MKLSKLSSLHELKPLSNINPIIKTKVITCLNEIELISYSVNLCLFSSRILRNEIVVKNRDKTLSMLNDEINRLNNLLSKKDILLECNYTKKDIKEFNKKVGLKSKHIEN